jgi:hypothetical protein
MANNNNDRIWDVLDNEGVDYEVYDDYSGRGMFGATCTGFVVDDRNFKIGTGALEREGVSYRTDNMGLDYIIY